MPITPFPYMQPVNTDDDPPVPPPQFGWSVFTWPWQQPQSPQPQSEWYSQTPHPPPSPLVYDHNNPPMDMATGFPVAPGGQKPAFNSAGVGSGVSFGVAGGKPQTQTPPPQQQSVPNDAFNNQFRNKFFTDDRGVQWTFTDQGWIGYDPQTRQTLQPAPGQTPQPRLPKGVTSSSTANTGGVGVGGGIGKAGAGAAAGNGVGAGQGQGNPDIPKGDNDWGFYENWAKKQGLDWTVLRDVYLNPKREGTLGKYKTTREAVAVAAGEMKADGKWAEFFTKEFNRAPNELEWNEHAMWKRNPRVYRDPILNDGHNDIVAAWNQMVDEASNPTYEYETPPGAKW